MTSEALAVAEADLHFVRALQIHENNLVPHTRDLEELKQLHRHLFQDLFAWAGEIRTIDMKRGEGKFFAPCAWIELNAQHAFAALREENYLRNLSRSDFIVRLAFHYDAVNFIHPFREGNGRTQRFFWSRVALEAGWVLDWRPIHGEELNEASRVAREDGDMGLLLQALEKCVSPVWNS
ncbi:Fic family protein [Leucobacter sp. cx-42]|uniref:Fic/DOC family protein n=1 Tax=unclassified Leucobacter TaxID=2621730 RepID=UPI00165E0943|nr:Fic family protein [Leucobacter sp. cx-42]